MIDASPDSAASEVALDMSSFVDVLPDAKMATEKALKLSVTPRHAVIGTGNSQVCVTVTARDPLDVNDEDCRAPVDIVVALDNSDSMRGDKKLTPDHKNKALASIKSLETRGCTNISAAIGLASQELRRVSSPRAVRSIFLLTDGLANRGILEPTALVRFTKSPCLVKDDHCDDESSTVSEKSWVNDTVKAEAPTDTPITLHCFGYGSDHDSRMLQAISAATRGGTYYFVEDDSNVLTAIGGALGGVLSVVAQNAVLNISVPEESRALGAGIIRVHHKNIIERQDGSVSVSLGDFYAEESRDIIFEVKLATPPRGSNHLVSHASVSLSFTDTLLLEPASCPPTLCAANPHVKIQWLRLRVTEAISEADKLSQGGDVRAARAVINGMLEAIELSADDSRSDPLVKQLLADLNRIQEGLVSVDSFNRLGCHRMQNTMQMHESQRCTDSLGSLNVYRKSEKSRTIGKFVGK